MNLPLLSRFRRTEILAVLAHRDFRFVFLAQVVSSLGDAVYWVALPWLVLNQIGTATAVGITGAAAVLPVIFLTPFAGVLADRLDRKNLMVLSHVARIVVLAALLLVSRIMPLETVHFAVAGLMLAAAGLVFYPARAALLPNLLPREALVAGNATLAASMQAIRIGGTAAAGFLFATIGGLNALGGVLVAYAIAAVLLTKIRAPARAVLRSTESAGIGRHVKLANMLRETKSDLILSVKFMLTHPVIRAMAFAGVILNAFHFPAMGSLLPVYFRQALQAGPESFGLFGAIESAAILAALPAAPWLAKRFGDGKLSSLALAALGILVGLLAITGQIWHVFAVAVLMGFLTAGVLPMQSLVQAETPDYMRGKVVANLTVFNVALTPFTVLLGGLLIDAMGARPIYLLTGIVVVLSSLGLLLVREVRQARLTPQGEAGDSA